MSVLAVPCADLYCGAGGTSTGLYEAAAELGLEVQLVAVNHWQLAIATHSENHPDATHLCAGVRSERWHFVRIGGRRRMGAA
jgi:DNA (cytosine-5)-methyltransferase 1